MAVKEILHTTFLSLMSSAPTGPSSPYVQELDILTLKNIASEVSAVVHDTIVQVNKYLSEYRDCIKMNRHRHAMIHQHTFVGTLMYIVCLCPNLVSVHFYAIPILHFKFPNLPLVFLLL